MSLRSIELIRLNKEGYAKLPQKSPPQSFLVAEQQKAKKRMLARAAWLSKKKEIYIIH